MKKFVTLMIAANLLVAPVSANLVDDVTAAAGKVIDYVTDAKYVVGAASGVALTVLASVLAKKYGWCSYLTGEKSKAKTRWACPNSNSSSSASADSSTI